MDARDVFKRWSEEGFKGLVYVALADDLDTWCVMVGDDALIRCASPDAARSAREVVCDFVGEAGRLREALENIAAYGRPEGHGGPGAGQDLREIYDIANGALGTPMSDQADPGCASNESPERKPVVVKRMQWVGDEIRIWPDEVDGKALPWGTCTLSELGAVRWALDQCPASNRPNDAHKEGGSNV